MREFGGAAYRRISMEKFSVRSLCLRDAAKTATEWIVGLLGKHDHFFGLAPAHCSGPRTTGIEFPKCSKRLDRGRRSPEFALLP